MNLWLVGVSQSVRRETCGVFTVQLLTRPVIWVWFWAWALFKWDSYAGRTAVLTGVILKPLPSKGKIHLWYVNVSSSCLTLGKRNGCWPRAICCLFSAAYWRIQIVKRWSLKGWDPFVSRWNSTGVHEDMPHPSLKDCGSGTAVTHIPKSLVVSHHLS